MRNHANLWPKGLFGSLIVGAAIAATAGVGYGQYAVDENNRSGGNDGAQINEPRANSELITDNQTTEIVPETLVREALDTNRQSAQRTNIRAPVVEAGALPIVNDDPFAPVGIQIGSLRLTSFFKQSLGFTSNKLRGALGDGGVYSLSEVNFQLRSQWQRHEFAFNVTGEYEDYFDRYIEPSPTLDIDGSLRLDLVNGFSATLGGNYGFEKEAATSTSLTSTAINEPGVHSFGGFGEVQRAGHRIDLTLRGSIDRLTYEEAKLSGGGTFSQEDRNVTTFGVSARAGYQSGLAYSPFLQASIAKSIFDLSTDRNGEQRDSITYDLRGGISIDISEKINGEITAGYSVQEFADPGLASLAGLVIDANLNWSPQRDTLFSLTLGSSLGGSTTAGDSGAITYNSELAVTRRIRDNLEITGGIGLAYTNYEGLNRIDTTLSANLGFEYWLNRTLSITGDSSYENLDSSIMANSYDGALFVLGIKVQR